jgi:hypothetical protein
VNAVKVHGYKSISGRLPKVEMIEGGAVSRSFVLCYRDGEQRGNAFAREDSAILYANSEAHKGQGTATQALFQVIDGYGESTWVSR